MAKKSNAGRPALITPDRLQLLEDAFKIGCTDLEACLNANISKSTLYNYQEKNPEFVERKELLKNSPVFTARNTVVKAIKSDPDLALKYLERKVKREFSPRSEITGEDGGPIKQDTKWTVEIVEAKPDE